MRSDRKKDLLKILHAGRATSQQEIVEALRDAGHDVTQATVSRDLRNVGAAKIRSGDTFVYLLPDELARTPGSDVMVTNLERTLDDFAIEVKTAHSIVVVMTAPGHASAVGRAIDLAGLPQVAGTVAGDDTIFVATPSPEEARELAASWGATDRED